MTTRTRKYLATKKSKKRINQRLSFGFWWGDKRNTIDLFKEYTDTFKILYGKDL